MLLSIVLKMIVAGGIHAILTLSAALLDNGILTGNFENVLDIKFFMLIAAIIANICQIGNVTSAAHYLLILMNSLLIMQLCYPLSSRANESMARIFEVLDATPEIRDPENSLPLDPEAVEGRVGFEHVSQSYPFIHVHDLPITRTIENLLYRVQQERYQE
ncbi:hypothetical protein KSK55_05905 [Methanospirillum purgamenti]|uniref:Uncharacterized protein n=1 Tax=Methanospirillum hungatei TaxID=2203 RepID=A0A8F5VQ59_METHU|nr:hypothetical protein [Methanospirillum hungatei]QXO95918.1 hypothetical protein KSK55_05905 [Methanospirillum hungatei]